MDRRGDVKRGRIERAGREGEREEGAAISRSVEGECWCVATGEACLPAEGLANVVARLEGLHDLDDLQVGDTLDLIMLFLDEVLLCHKHTLCTIRHSNNSPSGHCACVYPQPLHTHAHACNAAAGTLTAEEVLVDCLAIDRLYHHRDVSRGE